VSDPDAPFQRDEFVDEPGISGARWWQTSLDREAQPADPARRDALRNLLIGVGVIAGIAAVGVGIKDCAKDDFEAQPRPALEMQRTFGWAFGAASESLVFDGAGTTSFDRTKLASLGSVCAPARSDLTRYALSTIFEAPAARPTSAAEGDPQTFVPLSDALLPVHSAKMDDAYKRGLAVADLFGHAKPPAAAAVIVDLPGPESVAFAAGASQQLDPAFLFDNWPHPRGVVPAHLTLGALAYYQPLWEKTRPSRPRDATPLFVLDRDRLRPYSDEATQFDNRHFAKLPSASALLQMGVRRVLYVTPDGSTSELDDVNDDLVAYKRAGLDVRMVAATDFGLSSHLAPTPDEIALRILPAYYGGKAESHGAFFLDYPWADPESNTGASSLPSAPRLWRPTPRTTPFSSGSGSSGGGAATRPAPPGFGTIPVMIALGTGVVLGAKLSRSGSWTRSSGGWGG
jgi:hypothetical protein